MSMGSPVKKRTALAGKNVNARPSSSSIHKVGSLSNHTSPSKKSQVDLTYALNNSPVRSVSLSPKKSAETSAFTFHEETPSERAAALMKHMSLAKKSSLSVDENDFDAVKENMSPTKLANMDKTAQRQSIRRPLQDLSIEEHKGYVEDPNSHETAPLTLHYSRRTTLPTFVTPPRDQKLRECFTISNNDAAPAANSRTTDDIPKDKVVRKLNFKIHEN